MKKIIIFILLFTFHLSVQAQQKIRVLVIGSYHMGNPGLDKFNMEADDISVPKRQKEIEDFVTLLSSFKPTKICVEYPFEKQSKLQENYKAYLDGNYELRKDESDQIGFRLAKKLKLPEINAIDTKAPFNMDTVMQIAQQFQFTAFIQKLGQMPAFIESENKKLHESTITQFYQYMNDRKYVRMSHELYLGMAEIGKDNNYAGADLVADWYKRNLRIYSNLTRLQLKPEDRVLIIYGAGHTKILQDLIDDSVPFKLVELSELSKNNK